MLSSPGTKNHPGEFGFSPRSTAMATDYLLFVHGVKTRREAVFRNLASTLFKNIQRSMLERSRVVKPTVFF